MQHRALQRFVRDRSGGRSLALTALADAVAATQAAATGVHAGSVTTLEALRADVKPLGAVVELSHLEKMTRLTQRHDLVPAGGMDSATVAKLAEAGFVWRVPGSFVGKFRYAADLRSPSIVTRSRSWDSDQVVFAGDLPDWVADRGLKAVELGAKHLTIHSNEPLPVKFVKMVDPVLLAWFTTVRINHSGGGNSRWISTDGPTALVVAAWDVDKELVL